jgi:hypothetical protein
MAFEQLFIRVKKTLGGIALDAVLEEFHTNDVLVTKNPVEYGADVTDHAIVQPKRLNLRAVVSDTPLGTAAFGVIVDNASRLFGRSTSDSQTRSTTAYNALLALQAAREPIDVQTKLRLYSNMLITNITVGQDKDTSREVQLDITLEEIQIVATELITLAEDQLGGAAKVQATSAENRGRQQPIPVTGAKREAWSVQLGIPKLLGL